MADSFRTPDPRPDASAPRHPRIGVVAIGRNEAANLATCLVSAAGAACIVYVDSASHDDSVAIALAHGAQVVVLDPAVALTAGRARNAGFARLLALDPLLEFVQFVDGDCELRAGWIDAAVAFLDGNGDAAVVCGRRRERHPDRSIYNALCEREWNTPVGPAQSSGGDALVRVAAFRAAGGFRDDQVAHEEPELGSRLRAAGWTIWRIDAAMTLHDAAIMRLGQFYRRSRRAGLGISQYLQRGTKDAGDHGRAIIRRALLWGMLLPITIVLLCALDWRLALVVAALYPLQIARQAMKQARAGWSRGDAVRVAILGMVSKLAEAHGTIEFWWRHLLGQRKRPITYR